jgi:hypothetical protein
LLARDGILRKGGFITMTTASYFDEMLPLGSPDHYDGVNAETVSDTERNSGTDLRTSLQLSEIVNELLLAARVETELRAVFPCEVVRADDGVFTVDVDAPLLWEDRLVKEYNAVAKGIPGVKRIRVHILASRMYGQG